jgi:hypothetical protein
MNMERPEDIVHLENPKTFWSGARFIEEVEHAVHKHSPPFENFPDLIRIDGVLAETSEKLIKETFADPERKERLVDGKVDLEGRLVVNSNISVGSTEKVRAKSILRSVRGDPRYTVSERIALLMHTHGIVDTPPSPIDFLSLITEGDRSHEVDFVFTESKKYLLLRSLETPEMPDDQAVKELEEYKERHAREVAQLRGSDQRTFDLEQVKILERIFLDMCKRYKIAYYLATEGHEYHRVDI